MLYKDAVRLVSQKLNLPEKIVDSTFKADWLAIKNMIKELPLKEATDDEFKQLRPNFNLPSLGKLCCTEEKYSNMKKRFEYIKKIRKSYD